MLYQDAYDIIARYANALLPRFADRFERFPVGENAETMINELDTTARFWAGIDENVSTQIAAVAAAIADRMGE